MFEAAEKPVENEFDNTKIKKLKVVLAPPKGSTFAVESGKNDLIFEVDERIKVSLVEFFCRREIILESSEETSLSKYFEVVNHTLELMALSEGQFSIVDDFSVCIPDEIICADYKERAMKSLLPHLSTSLHFVPPPRCEPCSLSQVLTTSVYKEWVKLNEELVVALHIFFYASSEAMPYRDICVAWLIELMEPLSEYVENKTKVPRECMKNNEGEDYVTLKNCIRYLASECWASERCDTDFKQLVFKREFKNSDSRCRFLQACTHSRNRLMHIKSNEESGYFNSMGNIVYAGKFHLLIRHILLSLLLDDLDVAYPGKLIRLTAHFENMGSLKESIQKENV